MHDTPLSQGVYRSRIAIDVSHSTGLKLELGLRIVSHSESQLSLGWGRTYMAKAFFGTPTGHQKIGTYENVTLVVHFKKLSIDSGENLDVVDALDMQMVALKLQKIMYS